MEDTPRANWLTPSAVTFGDDKTNSTGDVNANVMTAAGQHMPSTPVLEDDSPPELTRRERTASSCQMLRHAVLTLYRLDDFFTETLGNGFFSDVYKVTHKVSGEIMVLKMNTDAENRPNSLREVQLMNRMSHPNILKFLGVCVHGGQLHALTEFINGGSLNDIIENKQEVLTWQERVSIAQNISNGMAYLHSQGIFHRDLTSRNILISVDGTNKKAIVGDFGLATKIPDPDKEDFHLSVVGSPYWISPECIKGQRYDQRADVFSFGIILCELMALIDANPDLLPRTQNFGLDYIAFSELVEDCPLHLLYLAFRCCQMDPTKRPPFTEIVCKLQVIKDHRLSCCEPDNPVTSKSPILAGHVQRHINRFSKGITTGHKRSKSAGQTLDFLQTETTGPQVATPQFIGEHMTKEDPFYTPAPANTNPFTANEQFKNGHKLLASENETEHIFDISMTLPLSSTISNSSQRQSHSLPDAPGMVKRAVEQFNSQITDSQNNRANCTSPVQKFFDDARSDVSSVDSAVDMASCRSTEKRPRFLSSSHNKQLNLECAMLFCGLDLIQMHRTRSTDWIDMRPSTDLESEFQDDLDNVLRSCSPSESWMSIDDCGLSPTASSSDMDNEWWLHSDKNDTTSSRYFHPTLIEKRQQLRRVESRTKEKLEQLQLKLDKLRLSTKKTPKKSTSSLPS